MSHSHGRVECEVCHKIVQQCRCMESGKTVEWVVCPSCKANKAVEVQKQTSELNQKLRELGVSASESRQCGCICNCKSMVRPYAHGCYGRCDECVEICS